MEIIKTSISQLHYLYEVFNRNTLSDKEKKQENNIMLLNESQKKYAQLITEELHVTDKQKLNWMAQYAQIHAIHEGVETPGAAGYNAINQTPLNTIGIANPMLPQGNPEAPFDPVNGQFFHDPAYVKGSTGESEVRFERIFFVTP